MPRGRKTKKTFRELYQEFEDKVVRLRERCEHEKLSQWLEQHWAPGHSAGILIRICETCEKVIESRPGFIKMEYTKGKKGEPILARTLYVFVDKDPPEVLEVVEGESSQAP